MLYKKIANTNYNEVVLTTSQVSKHGLKPGRVLSKRIANRRAKRIQAKDHLASYGV